MKAHILLQLLPGLVTFNCFHKDILRITNQHEKASIDMFDHLIEVNELKFEFEKYCFSEKDFIFIKELIYGILPGNSELISRQDKIFLYEIISNKRTSVDVDKWDYFARDCLMVGMKSNFDHMRCMKFRRVIDDGSGKMQLCLRDKEVSNIYEMFQIRNNIHRLVCKHAVTLGVEMMHVDALVLAEKSKLLVTDGTWNISECIKDMDAFTKLNDNIFNRILYSTEENLQEARKLLERVENRKLYRKKGLPSAKYSNEKHIPRHNYTGPGARLDLRFDSNDNPNQREEPICRIDQAALKHDIIYRDHEDLESSHKADQQMIHELESTPNPREKVGGALVTRLLKSKMKLGMGIADEIHK
ncbi:hypothetical protein LOTGIDRAFT_175167 [Lottia gigantea]|uniref:Phospholipase A2-like domain-containing protein n=1 Tax=Lottia gigantea TaxID=225164 RepID=V4C234_LOTGI|nr:hypothetical protein LOTGIDRAFT_175167 [Lottia gigantea]ESO95549.1 hypothetical protein LOTGIDRAFT_175167 [Lottia gigantea]